MPEIIYTKTVEGNATRLWSSEPIEGIITGTPMTNIDESVVDYTMILNGQTEFEIPNEVTELTFPDNSTWNRP